MFLLETTQEIAWRPRWPVTNLQLMSLCASGGSDTSGRIDSNQSERIQVSTSGIKRAYCSSLPQRPESSEKIPRISPTKGDGSSTDLSEARFQRRNRALVAVNLCKSSKW